MGAFGTTNGPKARFCPKVLLTYGGGPTTDNAKGAPDVPAAARATIFLDGGYHRLAIEEIEKILPSEPAGTAVGRRRAWVGCHVSALTRPASRAPFVLACSVACGL